MSLARIDESIRRLLLVKLRLGLFADPFVDEERATVEVGSTDSFSLGRLAQSRSVTALANGSVEAAPTLPLRAGLRLYLEGVDSVVAARFGTVVEDPADADLAIIRLRTPFDHRGYPY